MKNAAAVPEDFDIEFVKLKDGEHVFQYGLAGAFFEAFENTDVHRADIAVNAVLEKHVHIINVDLQITGTAGLSCDRCLETIDFPIDTEYRIVFQLLAEHARKTEDENDLVNSELVVVEHSENSINFARQVYESVLLGIPMLRNCDDMKVKPCNMEMLQKLEELNQTRGEGNDPRWDKLKDLLK